MTLTDEQKEMIGKLIDTSNVENLADIISTFRLYLLFDDIEDSNMTPMQEACFLRSLAMLDVAVNDARMANYHRMRGE